MWNWEIRQNDNTSLPTDSTDHDQLETTCKTEANLGKPYENILLDNLEFNIPVDPSNNNGEGLDEDQAENSLNKHRSPASETCSQSVLKIILFLLRNNNQSSNCSGRESDNIPHVENKHPVSLVKKERKVSLVVMN